MHASSGETQVDGGSDVLPISAFSAFNLLKNCNYLLAPHQPPGIYSKEMHINQNQTRFRTNRSIFDINSTAFKPSDKQLSFSSIPPKLLTPSTPLWTYPSHIHHVLEPDSLLSPIRQTDVVSPISPYNMGYRRQRGEKKPIPEAQKDDKYFERRRRNNQAAKKSRDARKTREDHVALRATLLEHENAILRAQVLTLREETSALRQILIQKKSLELTIRDSHN